MKIKVITLFAVCIAAFSSSFAQIRLDPYYPYSKYSLGIGMGYSQMYGDWQNTNSESVTRINIDRNLNEWIAIDLQGQRGGLSSYESKNLWTTGLTSYNTFTSVHLQMRISLGELFNAPHDFIAKTIFGIYLGAGGGYMWNDVSKITTKFRHQDQLLITDYNASNIQDKSSNFYIPFCIGINLHLTKRCMFNVNYEFNYAFSDYVDGYNFQQPTADNRFNDMYTVLSFGLNFYLGHVGNSRKSNYRTRHY